MGSLLGSGRHACADVVSLRARRAGFLALKEADPLHQLRPVVLHVADLGADFPRLDLASVRLHIRSSRFPPIVKYVMQAKTTMPIADAITNLNEGVRETRVRFSSRMPVVRGAPLPASSLIAREPPAYLAALASA